MGKKSEESKKSIGLKELADKYKEIRENYDSLNSLIQANNPWTDGNISKLSEDFFAALKNEDKDFSWLNVDEYLYKELKDKERAVSIDYGIPSHVRGDVENGTVFLCLVNPNIQYNGSKRKCIHSFYDEARKIESEDKSLKVLDENGDISITKQKIKNYIFDTRSTGGILYQELDENGIENPGYYTSNYFNVILKSINDFENSNNSENCYTNKQIKNENEESNKESFDLIKISKKIVDLEAFPFRSSKPNFAKKGNKDADNRFANCLVNSNSKVSMLSSRIIIWKILEYINNPKDKVKPVFIIRRFNRAWRPSIEKVLREDFGVEDDIDIDSIFNELHKEYFYTLGCLDTDNFSQMDKSLYKEDKNIYNKKENKRREEFNERIFNALISQKDKKENKGYE